MTKTSLRKRFVPVGAWAPDSPEFAPGFLDQIVNVLPVFGVNRVVQSLQHISTLVGVDDDDSNRRVTGTYIHRISIDTSIDILQPDSSEEQVTGYPPKEGFQTTPPQLQFFYQALRGITPDASTTVLLIPFATEKTLFGTFEEAQQVWNSVDPLIMRFQYRIRKGFTGAYEFVIELGTVTDPEDEGTFTLVDDFTKSGLLEIDGNDLTVTDDITVLNAVFSDPGSDLRWAWRIRQTMDTIVGELTQFFNVTEVSGAFPLNVSSGLVTGYLEDTGSEIAADFVNSLQGYVAGAWRPDPDGSTNPLTPGPPGDEDLTKFARSRPIWSTESGGVGFFVKMDLPQFINLQNHKIKFTYSISTTGQRIGIQIQQGRFNNPILIQRWTNLGVSSPGQVVTLELTDVQHTIDFVDVPGVPDHKGGLSAITNWDDVWILFFTQRPAPLAVPTLNILNPSPAPGDAYFQSAPWVFFVSPPSESLADGSDLSGLDQPAGTSQAWFEILMEPYTGPREAISSVKLFIRASNGGGTSNVVLSLGDHGSASGFVSAPFLVPDTPTWVNYEVTVPIGHLLGTDLTRMFFRVETLAGSTGIFSVVELKVKIEGGYSSFSTLYGITWFGPELGDGDAPAPIDISWLRLDGPANDTNQQDTLRAYLGTVELPSAPATQEGKIFEVSSPSFDIWTDVSRAAKYKSNERDKSTSFTSFGSMVIATNYADPVQVKYEVANNFEDLIGFDAVSVSIPNYEADGGVYPRARFAATINAFLCLANCDPLETSTLGTAQPYTFWCSRYAQPQYFHIGLIEWQSFATQLVETPGEITGLVGGEYGLVFKENSIIRMDYVGLPEVFHPTQLSGQQGTVQPRSIVKVETDVYFFGGGGIYVVRDGRSIEEVAGQGAVRKFLFDSQFESYSLSTVAGGLETEASARVVGGFDMNSSCIFWAFMSKKDPTNWFKCDAILVYSPKENRFSFIHGMKSGEHSDDRRIIEAESIFGMNDLKLQGFLTLGNRSVNNENYLQRTILAVRNIPPQISSFSGLPYSQFYRSNTMASAFFQAPMGVEMEIHKVRPVIAVERESVIPPHTVWIEANQSPAIGDGTGRVISVSSENRNKDGWIDIGTPISGEFFKFAMVFDEYTSQIVKEVHGWQIMYRIAGDH